MPPFPDAKSSNAAYHPSYTPAAVFFGGTSGVGQGMAEALARHLRGNVHIVLVGRNEDAARRILAAMPSPDDGVREAPKREFVRCDVGRMANVRTACASIREKLGCINFLVLSAGYNSWVHHGITEDGLDLHLAFRYYYRAIAIEGLLSLLLAADAQGQDARVMSVLSAGIVDRVDLDNMGNVQKPRNQHRFRVCLRATLMSSSYTDALFAHLASTNPTIAFTHIHPGVVFTSALRVDFDGFLTPLRWVLNPLLPHMGAVSQDVCAEHMLYALLDGKRGLFLRDRYGDVISMKAFAEGEGIAEGTEPGVLNGVRLKGFGPSDVAVRRVAEHTKVVTRI